MPDRDRFDVTARVALVTGASRGIGRAIAVCLAEHGADVAVHYAGNASAADETAAAVRAFGRRATVVGGDLSDTAAAERIYRQTVEQLGRVDILVLNASIQSRRAWNEIPLAEAQQQVQVNLLASLQLIQLAAPAMTDRRWGRIVTIGSVQQLKPHPSMAVYAATKAAQENFVRNLAPQLAPHGVTINNLAPGVIETDRNADVLADPNVRHHVVAKIPVGFVGQSDDCVGAALLLCSDAGRYITGADLLVDGGWRLL